MRIFKENARVSTVCLFSLPKMTEMKLLMSRKHKFNDEFPWNELKWGHEIIQLH